jgi:hypothetical protein
VSDENILGDFWCKSNGSSSSNATVDHFNVLRGALLRYRACVNGGLTSGMCCHSPCCHGGEDSVYVRPRDNESS